MRGVVTSKDAKNLEGERGRSDFDIGHSFAASFIRSPKFSKHLILRDWQVAGTATMLYTGSPFTPRIANFNFANGEASRPDRIAKGTVPDPTVDQWFDRNLNTSVRGGFALKISGHCSSGLSPLTYRSQPNFNLPENRVDIISGDTISRAKSNRTMQVALRFEF